MNTADVRERIIQLMGMTGSFHDGEVLNAVRLARKLVLENKLTWRGLLSGSATTQKGDTPSAEAWEEGERYDEGYDAGFKYGFEVGGQNADQDAYSRGFDEGVKYQMANTRQIGAVKSWKQWAKEIIANEEDNLTEWEITFFGDFSVGRYAVPSDKQRAIFVRVGERLGIALPESAPNGQTDLFQNV